MSFSPGPDDRYIETSFLTILEWFKDYHQDIPQNARVVSVHMHKEDKGKLSMILESPDWSATDASKPIYIHFDLQHFVPVGQVQAQAKPAVEVVLE